MILEFGSKGHYVRAWQRIVGVHYSKVDGLFGTNTDMLTRRWQTARGVEADGVIGPATSEALSRYLQD